MKIKTFLFTTRLGYFITIFSLSVLTELIMLVIYSSLFIPMVVGSFFTSIILAIFSKPFNH